MCFLYLCPFLFRSSYFSFLFFGHFWRQRYENTKILRNPCLHFARQDGQEGKKGMKIMQLKWPKYHKPEDENMGWTKHSFHQGWPKTKWPIVWIQIGCDLKGEKAAFGFWSPLIKWRRHLQKGAKRKVQNRSYSEWISEL